MEVTTLLLGNPKIFRVRADDQFNMISAWVKQLEGWSQIERSVDLDKVSNSKDRVKVWVERAVFLFW